MKIRSLVQSQKQELNEIEQNFELTPKRGSEMHISKEANSSSEIISFQGGEPEINDLDSNNGNQIGNLTEEFKSKLN